MSERRFVISEIGRKFPEIPFGMNSVYLEQQQEICTITESELKRRCLVMCVDYENYGTVKIDILLHGEKEE